MHRIRKALLRFIGLPLFAAAATWLSGCGNSDGPAIAEVEGTVTMDDKPLKNAEVSFEPTGGGRPSTATTDENGYYYLKYSMRKDGALVGEHIVRIRTGGTRYDENDNEIRMKETVPARYNVKADDNPDMKKTVEAGGSTVNFDLTSDGDIVQPEDVPVE